MKPIICFWDGTVMVPLLRFAKLAAQQFTIGKQYRVAVQNDRSVASHNHYFAAIETQWRKLLWGPLGSKFQTSEQLRHYALIQCGWYHQRWATFSTQKDADKAAMLISQHLKKELVLVEDARVSVLTAQSQSRAEMGDKDFQASKKDVLEYIEKLVKRDGVEVTHDADGDLPAP
jgi:hypothetical protein